MREDFERYASEVRSGLEADKRKEQAVQRIKPATAFGEDNTPYLPIGDYTVLMADGGTGKTILCCGIAAAVSSGKALPGEGFDGEGENVLFISAEDSGEQLKRRLALSGADLNRCYIIDRTDSLGLNFSDNYEEFFSLVKAAEPKLCVIDPWHAFLGESVNINRVNAVRPVFQKLAGMAKQLDCALILVSHVNKRAQGENANNAATGSTDFINAARSALRVVFDDIDEDSRIVVHTKANYSAYGRSVRYHVCGGGLEWDGFSDITRSTLEAAARSRRTPGEVIQAEQNRQDTNATLMSALKSVAGEKPLKFTYDQFQKKFGDLVFGGGQPKRALEGIKAAMLEEGYFVNPCRVRKGKDVGNGFSIQRLPNGEPETECDAYDQLPL